MVKIKKRISAENTTKGTNEDEYEVGLHPLKGTVKKGYKDNDSNKDILEGQKKEILEKQVQSATRKSEHYIAETIKNKK